MMTNVRIYPKEETAKLLTNGASAFVIPFKKQPPEGFVRVLEGVHAFCRSKIAALFKNRNGDTWLECSPYEFGDTLYLLETWTEKVRIGNYAYKADGNIYYPDGEIWTGWNSPATMPSKQPPCRHVWKKWKIEAVLVKTIIDAELYHIQEAPPTFGKWVKETYPDLSKNSWVWFIEKA